MHCEKILLWALGNSNLETFGTAIGNKVGHDVELAVHGSCKTFAMHLSRHTVLSSNFVLKHPCVRRSSVSHGARCDRLCSYLIGFTHQDMHAFGSSCVKDSRPCEVSRQPRISSAEVHKGCLQIHSFQKDGNACIIYCVYPDRILWATGTQHKLCGRCICVVKLQLHEGCRDAEGCHGEVIGKFYSRSAPAGAAAGRQKWHSSHCSCQSR